MAGLSRRICIPLHANERTEKKVCAVWWLDNYEELVQQCTNGKTEKGNSLCGLALCYGIVVVINGMASWPSHD